MRLSDFIWDDVFVNHKQMAGLKRPFEAAACVGGEESDRKKSLTLAERKNFSIWNI